MKWYLAGVMLVAAFVGGNPERALGDVKEEYRQLQRDIPSMYLINGLFLSETQYDRLTVLLEKMAKLNDDCASRLKALDKRYAASVKKHFDQQVDNLERQIKGKQRRKYPRDRGLKRGRKEGAELIQFFRKERMELAEDFYNLLSDAQRETVNLFQPCFVPAQDFKDPVRVGQVSDNTGPGKKMLDTLRQADAGGVEEAREQVLDKAVPYVMHHRKINYTKKADKQVRDELRQKMDSVIPRVRELSDVDYELEKGALVGEILEVDLPHCDIVTGTGQTPEQKIMHYVINPGCLDIVRSRGTSRTRASSRSSDVDSFREGQVRERMRGTRVVKMLEMLKLSQDQTKELLLIVKGGNRAYHKVEKQVEVTMTEAIPSLQSLKKELANRQEKAVTEHRATQYHNSIKKLVDATLYAAYRPYEERLDKTLSVHQVNVLELGPNLKENEENIQHAAEIRDDAQRLLSKMRAMETRDYTRKRIGEVDEFIEKQVELTQDDVDPKAERNRMLTVIGKARMMDRDDYLSNREDLITALCVRHQDGRDVQYGHTFEKGAPVPEISRSTQLLFSDEAVEVMERITQ